MEGKLCIFPKTIKLLAYHRLDSIKSSVLTPKDTNDLLNPLQIQ